MVTTSQAASLRALEADASTAPFAALAARALVFQDEASAQKFVNAVLLATTRIREAWGAGLEGASKSEALLLAHMLFLLRAVALRFPSLAGIVPAPVAPIAPAAPEVLTPKPARRRRRKTRAGNFEKRKKA